jgi:hypothetical protein
VEEFVEPGGGIVARFDWYDALAPFFTGPDGAGRLSVPERYRTLVLSERTLILLLLGAAAAFFLIFLFADVMKRNAAKTWLLRLSVMLSIIDLFSGAVIDLTLCPLLLVSSLLLLPAAIHGGTLVTLLSIPFALLPAAAPFRTALETNGLRFLATLPPDRLVIFVLFTAVPALHIGRVLVTAAIGIGKRVSKQREGKSTAQFNHEP